MNDNARREDAAAECCPVCTQPLNDHVGRNPCTQSPPRKARGLYDLPVFGWAWTEGANQDKQ
jgi:hypothetical protein